MVVCPQPLQCQVLWGLTLELRQGLICNCTVMMSVDKIKMWYNFSHFQFIKIIQYKCDWSTTQNQNSEGCRMHTG
jgi:hypothetical protein